jgi:3-oxoadipate enol-lactonase
LVCLQIHSIIHRPYCEAVTIPAASRYNALMVRERSTAIGGRPTRWLEAGEANTTHALVWLHAFPLGADMWRAQLETVPDGWRLIAPDLAGFGGTADHTGPPSIDDFARDLDELAGYLGLRQFVLGGLSMGGYAVFAYLRLNPSRVKGIVLADTKSGDDPPPAREGRQKRLDLVAAKGCRAIADDMLPKLLGATTQQIDTGLMLDVRAMIESNSAEGVSRAILRLRDRPDATPQLASIFVPALVIVGEEDGITPVADARAMASALPEATLAVLPGAGHLSNLEAPDAFSAALLPWMAAL